MTDTSELVEPSNAEQAEWPDATFAYVHGLIGQVETLRRELDEAREALERATLAERERCAGIAEKEQNECEELASSFDDGSRERDEYDTAASVCRIIAKAIRALQETSDDK